jgi:hypothetical protein
VSGGYSNTHLEFPVGAQTRQASFTKYSAVVSLDRRIGTRWNLGGALGTNLTGSAVVEHASLRLSPGPLAAVTGSFRALDEGKIAPFLLFTGSLGGSVLWTSGLAGSAGGPRPMTALDARVGVTAGKTIAGVVTPYALARAFAGPVYWNVDATSTVGQDAYHYQFGAGLVVRVGRFDLDVEGVPLGERALVGGLGLAL